MSDATETYTLIPTIWNLESQSDALETAVRADRVFMNARTDAQREALLQQPAKVPGQLPSSSVGNILLGMEAKCLGLNP